MLSQMEEAEKREIKGMWLDYIGLVIAKHYKSTFLYSLKFSMDMDAYNSCLWKHRVCWCCCIANHMIMNNYSLPAVAGLYWKARGVCGQRLWPSWSICSWCPLLVCHSLLFYCLHVGLPQGVQVQQLLSYKGTVHWLRNSLFNVPNMKTRLLSLLNAVLVV